MKPTASAPASLSTVAPPPASSSRSPADSASARAPTSGRSGMADAIDSSSIAIPMEPPFTNRIPYTLFNRRPEDSCLAGGHPLGAVEPDRLAGGVGVLEDELGERRGLLWGAGRERNPPHPARPEVARGPKGQADHAALGRGVGGLADLALHPGDAGRHH